LARFYRLAGARPCFVTGCDEHGEKIAMAAAKAGFAPADTKAHCDAIAAQFLVLWEKLGIQFDRFVRTTDMRHAPIVAEFIERVWDNGDIYKSTYEGLYCTGCEEYKDPKELEDGDVCPIHKAPCEYRKEENYFFALSKYQKQLEEFHAANPDFVQPADRRNEVLGWIKEGLRDFSVSRANNPWGIPVPRDPAQTIYVWFDALLGYVSALTPEEADPTLSAATSKAWPAEVHVIGKDILRFHAVYWPAMLMSAGLPLPKKVFGHGFLTKDGLKMGKSLGNTLDPTELVDHFGSDAVRYYFLRAIDFGKDGDFSYERFVNVINSDLANNIGNLLNRSLNLLKKNCDSTLPVDPSTAAPEDHPLRVLAVEKTRAAYEAYARLDFSGATEALTDIARGANAFIDERAPWTAFKEDRHDDAAQTLAIVLEVVRIVAVGISPVTPNLSSRIYRALGLDATELKWEDLTWGGLAQNSQFPKPKPVLPRLEVPELVSGAR